MYRSKVQNFVLDSGILASLQAYMQESQQMKHKLSHTIIKNYLGGERFGYFFYGYQSKSNTFIGIHFIEPFHSCFFKRQM